MMKPLHNEYWDLDPHATFDERVRIWVDMPRTHPRPGDAPYEDWIVAGHPGRRQHALHTHRAFAPILHEYEDLIDQGSPLVELLADALPRGTAPPPKRLQLLQESSLLALGNLAGDGAFDTTLRDRVRAAGAMPPVVRAAGSDAPAVARTALWALANLVRGPAPRLEEALDAGAGDAVVRVLLRPGAADGVTEEALWAASLLSHACPPMHARLLESGAAARALAFLAAPPATGDSLRLPALRVVGNLAAGADACTSALLHASSAADSGAEGAALLPALRALLADERRALRKEAAWVVGNVCAGTPAHRAAAVAAGLPAALVGLLQTAEAS